MTPVSVSRISPRFNPFLVSVCNIYCLKRSTPSFSTSTKFALAMPLIFSNFITFMYVVQLDSSKVTSRISLGSLSSKKRQNTICSVG
jgi:hypothetical protein